MARFIISARKAVGQYDKVKEHCDIVSYSSKTNLDVAKILEKRTDSMFSVHFLNELKHIEDMSRVLFLAQGWNESFIRKLVDMGIEHFAVDNPSDLETFESFIRRGNVKLNLFLRMKLRENTLRTERYFVFGMDSGLVNRKIKELRDNNSIGMLGIHFHRKTQNMSEWNLKLELSNILEESTLDAIDIMNIGGGLPSEYANTNMLVEEAIFSRIDELREWLREKDIRMIIEPGRFIAAPAGKLVTEIMGIYDSSIIVDASVYNSDMDAIIVPVKLKVEGELDKGEGTPYVIKGITPCSMDLFRYRCYLKDPKKGDSIVFLNAGAYNFASDFCELEKLHTEVEE